MTSTIKVNTIQNACGADIIKESSNTITIGASGDTVTLGSGASQTGFGRTGTVDWQTTPKTGNFTAANGEGYFVNTTSSAITMTMPSGSAGAIVSIQDYNKTFDSNNFSITPASGEKINGGVADANLVIATEGQGLTFVYVDSTVGWKTVHENEFTAGGSNFISATGGTITTSGNCKIHTFTGPGTFCVSVAAACAANNVVSYVVVAGGGAGGICRSGGGGAGGYREVKSPATPYTASPLDGYPSSPNRVTVSATSFPITVGGGGTGSTQSPVLSTSGSNSVFSTITSAGGGFGRNDNPASLPPSGPAGNGGSGGGGANSQGGGSGNTPPVSPPQGNNGGPSASGSGGGGGGGAGAVGGSMSPPSHGGDGGAGVASEISGSSVTRAGGGGGGSSASGGSGGSGGGGDGATASSGTCAGDDGTANTGGGGGGTGEPGTQGGGAGGSGIVIIRYKVS